MLFDMTSQIEMGHMIDTFNGTTLAILYFVGTILSHLANDCILLMLHLSYYSIAYGIRLLRARLVRDSKESCPWKGSKRILLHLSKASTALESIFSFAALYIITTKLIIVSSNSFAIIYALVNPNRFMPTSMIFNMLGQVVKSLLQTLVVLHAADMPVYQVRIKFLIFFAPFYKYLIELRFDIFERKSSRLLIINLIAGLMKTWR